MSGSESSGEPVIIDLTGGIGASTSPMMSPSSRPRRGPAEVLDLASDGSGDEGRDGATASTSFATRRSRRVRNRRIVADESDEEGEDAKAKEEGPGASAPPSPLPAPSGRRAIRRRITTDDSDEEGGDAAPKEEEAAEPPPPPPSSVSRAVAPRGGDPRRPAPADSARAYLRARIAGVRKRSFDLRRIPAREVIPTGRTIKRMSAWAGRWPALREFLQNTIDHLGLLNPRTGRRHEALRLDVTKGASPGELATFRFVCGEEAVCTIAASRDELVIDQLYTFPIAPRALDTGVPDLEKSSSTSAGGFGDGFKTAAVALLALGKDFESLEWRFYAEGQEITWAFEGATRAAVGTFAKCQVLQVRIDRAEMSSSEGEDPEKRDNLMRQVIKVRGIGRSFVEEAVPRLTVFWDLDASTLVSSEKTGGDFIGPASKQPAIAGGVLGSKLLPESGVYVKGIWVRKAKITGTLMCFFGRRLEVNGRDRNDVDDDDLINAVVYLFSQCSNIDYLRRLLKPLRGKVSATQNNDLVEAGGESCSSASSRTSGRTGGRGNESSWLLKSPRFLNQVLEQHKDFILHVTMGVPRGAIYVSSKTTKSADPFIKWASEFLEASGCPLEPIEPGANRHLFREASEAELTERCVEMLKRQSAGGKGGNSEVLSTAFRKILTFMGLGRAKVFFSPRVAVAFVHNRSIYVPEAPLSRELLVKMLNVCQCHLEGADGERFSSLMQAVFETLPSGETRALTAADVDRAIDRAKTVRKENRSLLVNPGSSTGGEAPRCSSSSSERPSKTPHVAAPEIDLTCEENGDADDVGGGGQGGEGWARRPNTSANADLERQIARVVRRATEDSGSGKRKRGGAAADDEEEEEGRQDGALPPIIPPSDFGRDDAGHDSCLRPSSRLRSIAAHASLGGGTILCDDASAASIESGGGGGRRGGGGWSAATASRVAALRGALDEAGDVVRRSVPSLGPLLRRVRHGYDSSNDSYEAFCDGTQIVVNLHAYLPKVPTGGSRPPTLVHDLVVTVTHEIAHFLEPREGHGPVWRDTHMRMVTEVMHYLSVNSISRSAGRDVDVGAAPNKRRKRG